MAREAMERGAEFHGRVGVTDVVVENGGVYVTPVAGKFVTRPFPTLGTS